MADFESIIKKYATEDGSVPAEAIVKLEKAISTAVGNEFVEKPRYKAKLEEIDALNDELQTAKDSATTAEKLKAKLEAKEAELNDYKATQEAKAARSEKESAYTELLKAAGVSESRIAAVLKVSDVDGIELVDKDGKKSVKDADKLTETIKTEWKDFIVTTQTKGASVAKPPANVGGGVMTKDEIFAIKDPAERRAAIAENMTLFNEKGE